jgi:hypothetical protein
VSESMLNSEILYRGFVLNRGPGFVSIHQAGMPGQKDWKTFPDVRRAKRFIDYFIHKNNLVVPEGR